MKFNLHKPAKRDHRWLMATLTDAEVHQLLAELPDTTSTPLLRQLRAEAQRYTEVKA